MYRAACIFLSLVSQWAAGADSSHAEHSLWGSHGMALVSDSRGALYASHLPLYQPPHNYQIIYRVSLESPGSVQPLLSRGMVTVLPDNFDLARLVNGESFSIDAQVFAGHFERDGKLLNRSVLNFEAPLLVEPVSPSPAGNTAEYYYVRIHSDEAIFAHRIQAPPSFDAVGFFSPPQDFSDATSGAVACPRPETIDRGVIEALMAQCGLSSIRYLETRDFAD